MPICNRCRETEAHPGHDVCWNCGAELFELYRDREAEEEFEAMEIARDGEPEYALAGCDEIPF